MDSSALLFMAKVSWLQRAMLSKRRYLHVAKLQHTSSPACTVLVEPSGPVYPHSQSDRRAVQQKHKYVKPYCIDATSATTSKRTIK